MSERYVAVAGPAEATDAHVKLAEQVGRLLARRGAVVVCGGLGGVMEGASRGASAEDGTVVGILAGHDRSDANSHLTVAVATGLGQARNAIVVHSADAVIAIGPGYGTLSEIALALRHDKPVIGLDTWALDGVRAVSSPEEAVELALAIDSADAPL